MKVSKFDQPSANWIPTQADYAEKVAAIKADQQTFQLEECKQRADRYPTDLQIRFELGKLYFEAGKITEAQAGIPESAGQSQSPGPIRHLLGEMF